MERERIFVWTLSGTSVIVLMLHIVFAFEKGGSGWGVHHLAFFPFWMRISLPVMGLVLVLPPVARVMGGLVSKASFPERGSIWYYGIYLFVVVISMSLFFWFRVQVHLLGDGALWIRELTGPLFRMAGEPFTVLLVRNLYLLIGGSGPEDAEWAYRVLSWASGLFFILGVILVSEGMARKPHERISSVIFLLSSGTVQLFFGYVEHYAPVAVGIIFYLWLGMRCLDGKTLLVVPASVLGLTCAFHFVGLALLPSFGVLILKAQGRFKGLQAAVFPLFLLIFLLVSGFDFESFGIQPRFVPFWGGEIFHSPHALLSVGHITDVVNAHLLSAPMGIILCLCIIPFTLPYRILSIEKSQIFLGSAAIIFLMLTFLFNPEIGAFRDWDLFSLSALPVLLLGASLLARFTREAIQWEVSWIVGIISLVHLIPWIGVNANVDRAISRFEMILKDGSRLSIHALGASYDELRSEYERRGNMYRALKAAENSLEANPEHTRYLANVIRLLQKTGQRKQVQQVLEEVVKKTPDFGGAYLQLARFYREEGKVEAADASVRKALRLDPNSGDAHAELGAVLKELGNFPEAIMFLEKAVRLDGRDAGVYNLLGTVYGTLGRIEEATSSFRKALKLDPGSSEGWSNLGVATYRAGRLDESKLAFQRSLKLDPENPTAKNGLGVFLQRQGRTAAALRLFREALVIDPNDLNTLLNLASASYESGNLKESLSACESALVIDPTHQQTLYNMCALLIEMGYLDKAEACKSRYLNLVR